VLPVAGRLVISVPDLGDFHDVEVIDVLVAPGDRVELETPLITLETDKATMDIPATAPGKVVELAVKKGARVSKGDAVLVLEPDAGVEPPASSPTAAEPKVREAAGAAQAAGSVEAVELRIPDLGDFHDVEVIEVLVAEGEVIALETPLVTLETDKATMDVPATAAGRVRAVHVAKGARVNAGDLVATVMAAAGAKAPPAAGPVVALRRSRRRPARSLFSRRRSRRLVSPGRTPRHRCGGSRVSWV
jgi:pyruvate/2-oxoglutarate dehydrogenase complex dihydrolipoamide acyltransferase (E2) component